MPPPSSEQFSGIFINYRRDDSAGHAGRLFDGLAAHFGADQIFMDVDHIEPGQDFVEVLERAVASCEILLAVIGRHWLVGAGRTTRRLDNPDDFVRLEVASALRRDVLVIPVLVQGAVMPSPDELPDDLKSLARRNAVEVRDLHWRADLKRLIDTLERLLARRTEERERRAAEAQLQAEKEAEQRRLAEEEERLREAAAARLRAEEAERQRQREVAEAQAREAEAERLRQEEEERQRAAAEAERLRLAEEEKRRAEEAAAKADAQQRAREAEEARRRADEAEARRLEEIKRRERQAAEVEHQQRQAEEARARMLTEAAEAEERRRLEAEAKREREETEAAARAADEQKRRDEEERRKREAAALVAAAAHEAPKVEPRREEREGQEATRPSDEQKPPDAIPDPMFTAPASTSGSNRVVFIALGALVVMGIVAAVWAMGGKGSPPQTSANQIATATGTQPTVQTASVPVAATPTPSPTPEPIPTPDKAAFQKTLNAFIRKQLTRYEEEKRRTVAYGDLDGDRADDAAVAICTGPRDGTTAVCDLAVFRNEKGTLTHVTGPDYEDDVAADEVQSIKDGKIYGIYYEHSDTDPQCCPSIKKQVKVALVGNRLKNR